MGSTGGVLSPDPEMAGSYAAMQRAGRATEDLTIRTNTAIITTIDGKVVRPWLSEGAIIVAAARKMMAVEGESRRNS